MNKENDRPYFSSFISNKKIFFDMGNYHLWLSAEGEWGKKNHFVLIPEKKVIFQELSWMFFDKHELFTLLIVPRLPLWGQGNEWGEIPLNFHVTFILSLKMRCCRDSPWQSQILLFFFPYKGKQNNHLDQKKKSIYIYIYMCLCVCVLLLLHRFSRVRLGATP